MVYDSCEFGRYLSELRRKDKLSMNVVCDGICDVSVMSRIENGEKEVSKIVQDRLLGRLGVAPENYENMVFSDEYERWELRQRIISLIQHENMGEAEELLEYMSESGRLEECCRSVEDLDAKLELQFYLSMKAQIMCYRHADEKELRKIYAEAVRQTVTGFENKKSPKDFFANKKLSVEEINLLIEYGRFLPVKNGTIFIKHIISYIESNSFTNLAKAKVFPKAVYYLYLLNNREGIIKGRLASQLLSYATDAIECLRSALRSFHMCELLDMKMALISKFTDCNEGLVKSAAETFETDTIIDKNYFNNYGNTKEYSLEKQYVWCCYARLALKDIYARAGIKESIFEFGYIYLDMEVYCIEDIIRIRRNMLGISMYELSDGICSERTISRMERKLVKPRCSIVHKLLKRLGLSGEFNHTELICSDVEVQEAFASIRNLLNNIETDKLDSMLERIGANINIEIPQNKQLILRIKACNELMKGSIGISTYIEQIKQALECTLPYSKVLKKGEKYLTNEELACVNNILSTKSAEHEEVAQCFSLLQDIYSDSGYNVNKNLSMYEFVMHPIASYLGDFGQYDASDDRESDILYNTLLNRRITVAPMAMYGMLWNDMQRHKNNLKMHRKLEWKGEIKRCLILSVLANKTDKIKFFLSKL